ncbi:unnamed protein product [Calypogeia fissa]
MATEENKEGKMEKIAVVVRVRPLLKGEASQRSPWKLSSKSIASSKSFRPSVPSYSFTYDRVYGTKGTTLEIYEAHVKGIINSAVSGVSGTIVAYGQSGCGKTCTIRGLPQERGILVLAVQDVFKRVQEEKDREFLVRVSYFELDNEELIDLLASKKQKLDVHEDVQGGIVVAGLTEEIVLGTEQVLALLEYADARRFVGATNASNCRRRPHSIFQMVIESRLNNQESLLIPQATDAVHISVLNLVEVAAAKNVTVENDGTFCEEIEPDQSLITLDTVMSKLGDNAETKEESLPYAESKLTYLLKPSLGGNTRTCFICHVSPAMVHLDGTVKTLTFAAKATRVLNCIKEDEFWRSIPVLKRQRRETEEPFNKLKEEDYSQKLEDSINRRNALLMIELEREQMSIERFGKTSLLCVSETRDHDEDQNGDNVLLERDYYCEKGSDMQQFDCSTYTQTQALCEYIEKFRQDEELQDVDHFVRRASGELWLSPRSGSKRKRPSSSGKVIEKFGQVEMLFQSKMASWLNCFKADGVAERQLLAELRNLIEQQESEYQEVLAQKADDCRNLQQKLADLEEAKHFSLEGLDNICCQGAPTAIRGMFHPSGKVRMEQGLHEQQTTLNEALDPLKGQFQTEGTEVHGDLSVIHNDDILNEMVPKDGEKPSGTSEFEANLNGVANFEGEVQETGLEILGSVMKQHAEAQSCVSQESEEQQNVVNETQGKHTSTKRKSKANKVYKKYQNFQGRSEISNLRKELAVANETISALKDERDGLWRDLKQINASRNESDDKASLCVIKEDINGDNNSLPLLAAAVDELKAEVESTLSITDALLELVLETFQTLNADLKSFQEGVAELKALSCASSDLSESLEKAKLQLVTLRQGKLSSEKELHSMKSELAKLECVVERQSGVLRVLSDNESLLNELSSVRAAMKEAASASELRLSAIEQEYKSKLEKLESQRQNWKQENLQLEEKYSDIQCKLQTAQSEVHTLTQALEKKSDLEKKQTEIQMKFNIAETDVLRLTQALEKSKAEKKKKYSKSRQSTTEAEIVRLTHSLGEKAGLQEEIKRLRADLSLSQTKVERLEREVEENEKARREVMTKLKSSEHSVAKLTAELEEKERVEVALGSKLVCMENEVVKVTKLLEDTLSRVESQQRELIISRGKAEHLVRQLEEMHILEDNYSKSLDRLVQSETEVARLTDIITSQLEDKTIMEQDHTNFMYKLESSESEVASLTTRLSTVAQEKDEVEKELKAISLQLSKSESEVERLTENLVREKKERATSGENMTLESSESEVASLTTRLSTVVQEKAEVEKELKAISLQLSKSESEVERLTENLAKEIKERATLEENMTLESSESEVASLTTRLSTVLQEKDQAEKEVKAIALQLSKAESEVERLTKSLAREKKERATLAESHVETSDICFQLSQSESEVDRLTVNLAREKKERAKLEESHRESLDKLAKEKEQRKLLDDSNLELNVKLTREQQEKEAIEEEYQEMLEELITEQEVRKKWEEKNVKNRARSTHTEHEVEVLETKHQRLLDNVASLETKVMQLTEKLAAEALEKSTLETKLREIRDKLTKEQEQRKCLEEKHQDIVEQLEGKELLLEKHANSHYLIDSSESNAANNQENLLELSGEQEKRALLNKAHQDTNEKLAASQSEVAQLRETLTVNMQELKRLETEHAERVQLEEVYQSALQCQRASEAQLIQMTETLDRELQEKKRLEKDCQQVLKNLHKEQEERRLLQIQHQEVLDNLIRDEEQKREVLVKINHTLVQNLSGSEAQVVQLRETVTRELGEKTRLEEHHQEVLGTLSREQQERTALEAKYEETLNTLTMAIEEKDGLGKTQQDLLDKLTVSEAKLGQMAETLSTEVEERLRLEHRHQEIIEELTSDLEEKLIKRNEETAEAVGREKGEAETLENYHQKCLHTLDGLEKKVVELENSLAMEVQNKEKLELEYRKVLINFESLETEVARLTENLTRELHSKDDLEKHHNELLAQLASSNAVVARVNANLADEVAEKEKLRTDYSQMLTQFTMSKLEVENLTKRIEGTPQLHEELCNLQLKLAASEAKFLRQAEEQRESSIDEHKLLMVELDATRAQIKVLSSQNERLQQEQAELLVHVSVLETEIRRLKDEVGDNGQIEEHKDVKVSNTEASDLEIALKEKSKLEVEQHKLQLELLSHQGELSKLTKALRVSRKVVKEQKNLIHNLTSNQAEVLRLTTALGGRSGSNKVYAERNTATDPSVTGIPSGHCGPQPSSDEEHIRLQTRLVSAESEAARLRNVIQDKELVESKLANVQLKLTAAEAEIARLTAAPEEKSRLDEHFRRFQLKLSEAGLLRSRNDANGFQFSLEEFPSELIKIASRLEELKREVESKGVVLAQRERSVRDKEIGSDVDYESLNTIITLREKERDELQERCRKAESTGHDLNVEIEKHKGLCAVAESKVRDLSAEIQKHKDLEGVEKKLKTRCHKAEKDAADLRAKLQNLEEATAWLVRDKNLLEERLNLCEVQLIAAREAARSASKDVEMSQHQLRLRTAQHQSEMTALCDELSVKQAQKAELEAELARLLGQSHQSVRSHQEAPGILSTPNFRSPHWPKGPGHNLDSSWSNGNSFKSHKMAKQALEEDFYGDRLLGFGVDLAN